MLSCVQPFETPWTAACQASLSFTISQNLLKLMSIESVMLSSPMLLLLLLLISRFSHVRLCVTPEMAAHQAPPSWDSPGKNTGVGCHFLLQCMKVKSESEVTESCPTPSDPMDCSLPGSSIHGICQEEYWTGLPLPSPIQSDSGN